MPNKRNQSVITWAVLPFLLILLVDRYYWAQISQWREDQATNIWLGYTAGIGSMPVGLISSTGIPNPNGMVLLGIFLSRMPNLLSISFFLGILQISLFILIGLESFDKDWQHALLATVPLLSSVILRSTSVEFWNQYTITMVNILFIFWALRYLKNSSLWNLPPITFLILLAPAIYLAGIVNAIVMTLLTLGMMVCKRPSLNNFWAVCIIILSLILFSIFATWLPYFQNVSFQEIMDYNKTSLRLVNYFQSAWKALLGLPVYGTFQWADKSTFASTIKQADPRILSTPAKILLRLVGRIYLLQAVFAFTTFLFLIYITLKNGISSKSLDLKLDLPKARIVILSALFIGLSYTISSWAGGPAWMNGKRPDQTVQFLPLFLLLIFLLPVTLTVGGRGGKFINGASYVLLSIFCIVNLICGFLIIRDHLQYGGDVLSEADVPLTDKMQVIDFIADDWKKISASNVIPVDYDLGGGVWDWVPDFGIKLSKWYSAPMTEGRGFDYELLRQYGLKNQQEGIQLRSFGNGRYLITYAFEDPPQVASGLVTHHLFGRLRVSVVEK